MLFDSHAHLNDDRFDGDRDDVIKSLTKGGVTNTCEIAVDIASSYEAVSLAQKHDFIYASAGIYPHETKDITNADLDELKKILQTDKVVALGEIGLDYYYDDTPRDIQKLWFENQLELAKDTKSPVIIHTRDAMADTIEMLKNHGTGDGIIHCFSGSRETAKILLDLGYYISFSGVITFKNANAILDVVKYVPMERILIETDSPYLSPVPHRGERNCPLFVAEVAKKIADLRQLTFEDVCLQTSNNAKKVYRIK